MPQERTSVAEYEDKFIIINVNCFEKHGIPDNLLNNFNAVLGQISVYLPDNKYYVCNQDEPYAQKVIDIIIAGETAKGEDKQ